MISKHTVPMSESGLKRFWLRIILRINFVQLWMSRFMDNPPTAAAQLRVTVQHSCQAYDLCTKHIPSSACFPRSVCWSQPLLTNPHDTSDPVYRITKFGRGDQWQLFFVASDNIHWCMLLWYPLTPLPIGCICQEFTHTEMHSSHPVPDSIVVLVSPHHLMTSNVTPEN